MALGEALALREEAAAWYLNGIDSMSSGRLLALFSYKKRVLCSSIKVVLPLFPESTSFLNRLFLSEREENIFKRRFT